MADGWEMEWKGDTRDFGRMKSIACGIKYERKRKGKSSESSIFMINVNS